MDDGGDIGGDATGPTSASAAAAAADLILSGASVATLLGEPGDGLERAADAVAALIEAGAPARLTLARLDGARFTFGGLVEAVGAAIGAGDGLSGADRAAAVRARLESMAGEGRGVALVVDASRGLAEHAASHLARLAAAGRRLTAERRAVEPGASAVGVQVAAIGGDALEAAFAAENDPGLRRALESAVRLQARPPAVEAAQAAQPAAIAPSWAEVAERERAAAAAAAPVFALEEATAEAALTPAGDKAARKPAGLWPPSRFALVFGLGVSAVVGASVWEAIAPPPPPSTLEIPTAPAAVQAERLAPAPSAEPAQDPATGAVDAAFAEARRRLEAGALIGPEGAVASLRDAAAAAPGDPRVREIYGALAARLGAAMEAALASGDFATVRRLTAAAREAQTIAER